MQIYTKTGDQGETGLLSGVRVKKNAPRLEACGTLDELNAFLGLIRSESPPADLDELLERFQHDLFHAGSELVTVAPARMPVPPIGPEQIRRVEEAIDRPESDLPRLQWFILPGGTRLAAMFHVARTVCRRAERTLVSLAGVEPEAVSAPMLAYVNRLSDLFFVLARTANHRAGVEDVPWRKLP